jgi:simple sugar transport system ATP-binding protein
VAGLPYAIEMRNITKRFPGIVANDRISLKVRKGEIHALLGENGAGKSTLMNILMGLYQPDEGEILLDGRKVDISEPNTAIRLGINMVHQHFMLIDHFTVTENIILGMEDRKGLSIDYRSAKRKIAELSKTYGLYVDPDARIEDISVGMQQRVEILKTLYRGANILVLDEPTAVLTPQEIHELMVILRNLANEGRTIILITHKLKEIMAMADTVTIIRRGRVVDTLPVKEANEQILAEKMVGREVNFVVNKKDVPVGPCVLELRKVTARNDRGVPMLNELDLVIHAGEIVGIAGVDGNGQSELVECITGLRKVDSGQILLNGQDVTNQPVRKRTEAGIGHIPEDRQKRGLVLNFSVSENLVLNRVDRPPFSRFGLLNAKKIQQNAERLIAEYDVRTPDARTLIRGLSGGNQQKVIIAREIDRNPQLLIAEQPTRGLDVGAIEFIHRRLVEQRNQGKAVLLISFELDEVMNLCDRIAVIFQGKIVGVVDPRKVTEREMGLLMSGSAKAREETVT